MHLFNLDESTNYLDLFSIIVLKEVLLGFDGALNLSQFRDVLLGLSQNVLKFQDQRVIEHFESIVAFLGINHN